MKVCKRCKRHLEPHEFYPHQGMRDGLRKECKKCVRRYALERYYKVIKIRQEAARK